MATVTSRQKRCTNENNEGAFHSAANYTLSRLLSFGIVISGLESANLKLIRAEKHIDTMRGIIMDFLSDEPSMVTKHPDGSDEFKFIERPPNDISILAGEAIHQIRSALDHLAFQLVKLNRTGIALPADWEERCAFPLWIGLPKKTTTFNCFGRTLPGITKQAFTFIESVQPYNRGEINAWLTRIATLSNIDKHRYLTVIKGQADRTDKATVLFKGMETISTSIRRVEEGTKTESPYAFPDMQVLKMHVGGAFHPFVSFSDAALDPGVKAFPIQDLLQACLDQVNRIIVPAFDKFINQP